MEHVLKPPNKHALIYSLLKRDYYLQNIMLVEMSSIYVSKTYKIIAH